MTDYFKEIGYDPENPILEEMQEGGKPTPSHDYFKEIGYDIGPRPEQVQADSEDERRPWTETRVGPMVKEGLKGLAEYGGWATYAHSKFIDRLKSRVPGYDENKAVEVFVDGLASWNPFLRSMPEEAEEMLLHVLEADYLKADPNVRPENYLEDLLMMSPQAGSQVLLNFVPVAGKFMAPAFIGMQIMGQSYKEYVDQGVDQDRAYIAALGNAIMQAPLEYLPFRKLSKILRPQRAAWGKLRDILQMGGEEWATEMLQAYPDELSRVFATNPDESLLDHIGKVWDDRYNIFKRGAYEGLVAAPFSLFGGGAATLAGKAVDRYKKKRAKPEIGPGDLPPVEAVPELYHPDPNEQAPPPLPQIPSDQPGGGFRQAPTRSSSSVTSRHLEMMNDEQKEAYYNKSFDEQFADRQAQAQGVVADQENRKKAALEAADKHAKTKHALAYFEGDIDETTLLEKDTGQPIDPYDYVTNWEDRVGAVRKRIQKGLDLVAHQDIYSPDSIALSEDEYNRRAKLLGNLEGLYDIDKNQVPPDMRGALGLMVEQIGQSEPMQTTYLNKKGEFDLTEGQHEIAQSTYPDWFKTPFKIQYAVGEKGETKVKTQDFKYGLNRKEFMHVIGKLEDGIALTSRESSIADHILQIASVIKDTDPELTQQQDINSLEDEGYDIVGGNRNFGAFSLGDQVVLEQDDGTWDQYTVVSEDDGTGNMVFDSLMDRMYAKPADIAKTVAHKNNKYWESVFDLGGAEAMAASDPFLPGYSNVKPMDVAIKEKEHAALENNFEAIPLPKDAVPFGHSPIVSTDKHADRRKKKKRVGYERRKDDRRKDWVTRGDIDAMNSEDKIFAIQKLRRIAMNDLLTGLNNRNEWNRHIENIGDDIPHIFIDLDGFKWINDHTEAGTLPDGVKVKGGHVMGDQVLGFFGDMMRETMELTGAKDRVRLFRYGGDEFSVLPAERDSMTKAEMEKFEKALKEVSEKIQVDMLGKDGKYYQLDGLPYTSATGGTVNEAIAATEKAKESAPARYTFTEEGKVGAKEPPTLTEKRDGAVRRPAGRKGVPEGQRPEPPKRYPEARRIVGYLEQVSDLESKQLMPRAKSVRDALVAELRDGYGMSAEDAKNLVNRYLNKEITGKEVQDYLKTIKAIEAPARKAKKAPKVGAPVPGAVTAPILVTPKPLAQKPKAADYVADNIEIIEGDETALIDVTYRDPFTGELSKVPEVAPEALRDIENVSDMMYKFRECIKN